MARKQIQQECFTTQDDGGVSDRNLHAGILGNPAADEMIAEQAIQRAIRAGLSREAAWKAYGNANPAATQRPTQPS